MFSLFIKILTYLLPERMIRILFVSSIIPKIFDKDLSPEQCRVISNVLNLSENSNALEFGMKLSKFIWGASKLDDRNIFAFRDDVKKHVHAFTELRAVAEIVRNTPDNLKYRRDDMVNDLLALIHHKDLITSES